jgi:hypothetical protein
MTIVKAHSQFIVYTSTITTDPLQNTPLKELIQLTERGTFTGVSHGCIFFGRKPTFKTTRSNLKQTVNYFLLTVGQLQVFMRAPKL